MARAIQEAIHMRVNTPTLKKKHWQVQSATHLGQSSVFHLKTKNKIKIPEHYNICALRGLPTVI